MKKGKRKIGRGERKAFLRRVFLLPPLSFPRLLRNGKARLKVPSFSSQHPPPTRVVACFGRFARLIDQRRNAKGHPTGCPFLFKKAVHEIRKPTMKDSIKSKAFGKGGMESGQGREKRGGTPFLQKGFPFPGFPMQPNAAPAKPACRQSDVRGATRGAARAQPKRYP